MDIHVAVVVFYINIRLCSTVLDSYIYITFSMVFSESYIFCLLVLYTVIVEPSPDVGTAPVYEIPGIRSYARISFIVADKQVDGVFRQMVKSKFVHDDACRAAYLWGLLGIGELAVGIHVSCCGIDECLKH